MSPITAEVTIPDNHQVHLDISIPDSVPVGEADLMVMILPRTVGRSRALLSQACGILKGSPIADENAVDFQREQRNEG